MKKAKDTPKGDLSGLIIGTTVSLMVDQFLLAPIEYRCRYMAAIGDDSQVAHIRKTLVEDGQLTDARCMPLSPEEADANPGKQAMLISGFTLAACAADAGIKLNAKVQPRKSWDVILEEAVSENLRRDNLGVMDISAIIHRFLALGKSVDWIRVKVAPPGQDLMSPVRFQQHRDLMEQSELIRLMAASGKLTADAALGLTNKAPAVQQRQLKAVETHRLLQLRDQQIADRQWVERIQDATMKAALAGTLPPMPELERASNPKRRKAKAVDAPVTAGDLKEADEKINGKDGKGPAATSDLTAPMTTEEMAEAFKQLRSRGGLMTEVASYLEGLRLRKLTHEQFCDAMVAIITDGSDDAKQVRKDTQKIIGKGARSLEPVSA